MASTTEALTGSAGEQNAYIAPQWKLMWWRFRKHKVAIAASVVLAVFYLVGMNAEFFATSDPKSDRTISSLGNSTNPRFITAFRFL